MTGPGGRAIVIERVLTERQQEIVMWTWYGLSDARIAARLHIQPKTVKYHQQAARRCLGLLHRGSPRVLTALWLWGACLRAEGRR